MVRRVVLITGFLFASLALFSQKKKDTIPTIFKEVAVTDCFDRSKFKGGIIPDSIRSNEILSSQRVWRVVSLEDEGNRAAFLINHGCEQVSLFEVIKFGLFELKLNAFDSDDFREVSKSRLSPAKLRERMSFRDSSATLAYDREGNETTEIKVVNRYYQGSDVQSFLLKEDWVMSSKSGVTIKLIVGIAPLIFDPKTEKVRPLFWLYYPEWKEVFSKFKTINQYDKYPQTYLQIFNRRKFFSQIVKNSNLQDRSIRAVHHGEDIKNEAETTKEKLSRKTVDYFEE
jgi:hypothetical protein